MKHGFTLIELLIVIAILAILATATMLVINPTEAIKKIRDTQRIRDLDTLKGVLILYLSVKGPIDLEESCTPENPCQSNQGDTPSNTSGSGWIPLDFSSMPAGSPISSLSVDPLNDTDYYYRFAIEDGSFELDCAFESKYYNEKEELPKKDNGNNDNLYEVGSDLEVLSNREGGGGYTVSFDTFPSDVGTITFDGISYNDGDTVGKVAADYDISANPGIGYNFNSWITTGGLSVINPASENTVCTVSDSGTLKMEQTSTSSWYNPDWHYRKQITINHSQVSTDLFDFPVLISVADSDLKEHAKSDGSDILFVSGNDTTKLKKEIEDYDSSNGSLTAWVRIPSLSSVSDTKIYIYYGNSGSSEVNDDDTWDNNYYLVQHLNEDSGTFYDSTSHNNDGTDSGGVTYQTTGKIKYGASFDGNDDIIQLPSSNNLTGDNLENCTMSIWVKYTNTDKDYPMSLKRSAANSTLISFQINPSGTGSLGVLTYSDGLTHTWLNYAGSYNDGVWHYLAATVEGATRRLYIDGSEKANDSNGMASVTGNSAPAAIGGFAIGYGSFFYGGTLDEARFSRIARSADWISTEYNNQNNPGSFYTFGAEEQH